MKYKRILAIGDSHGCVKTLTALLEQVKPTSEDLVAFTGDFVDRGIDSYGVIERLIALKNEFPQTVFVMGNHEDLFLRFLGFFGKPTNQDDRVFMYNGGGRTLQSYEVATGRRPATFDELPLTHQEFFRGLVPIHEEEDFIFVHGGLRPGFPLGDQQTHDMIWIRNEFLWDTYDFGKVIVHGHTPMEEPELTHYHEKHKGKRINVDSGCVFGYTLTCVDVLSGAKWEQKREQDDVSVNPRSPIFGYV
jgi:serine/threonine protein phosphatase 1